MLQNNQLDSVRQGSATNNKNSSLQQMNSSSQLESALSSVLNPKKSTLQMKTSPLKQSSTVTDSQLTDDPIGIIHRSADTPKRGTSSRPRSTATSVHSGAESGNEQDRDEIDPVAAQKRADEELSRLWREKKLQKHTNCGIEYFPLIKFPEWKPGFEYHQQISIKNIAMKSQQIIYTLPTSRFFNMAYPEAITINPGMSCTLSVTFRPDHAENYRDFIFIKTEHGTVRIPIEALLPAHRLKLPTAITLSHCPTNHIIRKQFILRNEGDMKTWFRWRTVKPWKVKPDEGVVDVGEEVALIAEIYPEDATIYHSIASCEYGTPESESKSHLYMGMECHAIAKIPHLSLEILPPKKGIAGTMGLTAASSVVNMDIYGANAQNDNKNHERSESQRGTDSRIEKKQPDVVATIHGDTNPTTYNGLNFLDFGVVQVGKKIERTVRLWNRSPVKAKFVVEAEDHKGGRSQYESALTTRSQHRAGSRSLMGSAKTPKSREKQNQNQKSADFDVPEFLNVFACSMSRGEIPSGEYLDLKFSYTPMGPAHSSAQWFNILVKSGNCVRLQLRGRGEDIRVRLSEELISFGDIPIRTVVRRTIQIHNDSDSPAYFQFLSGPESVFVFERPQGLVPPRSTQSLVIRFNPKWPINYYKRVYWLIQNGDIKSIDLLATAYDSMKRPPSLRPHHLSKYIRRLKTGLQLYSPEQLEEMVKDGLLKVVNNDFAFAGQEKAAMQMEEDEYLIPNLSRSHEFYHGAIQNEVTISVSFVDFGVLPEVLLEPEVKKIHITNRTRGQITCVWTLPEKDMPFKIEPKELDVQPSMTGSFTVTLLPTKSAQHFFHRVECYAFYTTASDFRWVRDDTLIPSWCLPLDVSAMSAQYQLQVAHRWELCDSAVFGARVVPFGGIVAESIHYRVVRVQNDGELPLLFELINGNADTVAMDGHHFYGSELDLSQAFVMLPARSMIKPKESQLFLVRFHPNKIRSFEKKVSLRLNHLSEDVETIYLTGLGCKPHVSIEGGEDGHLLFRGTSTLDVASKPMTLKNDSAMAVTFKFQLPENRSDVLSIQPLDGEIPPFDVRRITVNFSPKLERQYISKIPCEIGPGTSVAPPQRLGLTVIGTGVKGALTAQPQLLPLNHIPLYSTVKRELIIRNSSECDIRFHLEYEAMDLDFTGDSKDPLCEIDMSRTDGILPPRCNSIISVRVTLTRQTRMKAFIFAVMKGKQRQDERFQICEITAIGAVPQLEAIDIRSEFKSKNQLWRQFSIVNLNSQMMDGSPTVMSLGRLDRQMMFDFGPAAVGSPDSVVYLTIQNTGKVPAEWQMAFLRDLDIPIDNQENLQDAEDSAAFVKEQRIISFTPKSGKLESNEKSRVKLAYKHISAGNHQIMAVIMIKHGQSIIEKPIVILLHGQTLPPAKPFFFVPAFHHVFKPLPIGLLHYPIQSVRFYNEGTMPLEYAIDDSSLSELRSTYRDLQIFRLLSPKTGIIDPMMSQSIDFLFSPYEVDTYKTDLPVSLSNGDKINLTLVGRGLPGNGPLQVYKELVEPFFPPAKTITTSTYHIRTSKDCVNFGFVPVGTIARDLVILENRHKDRVLIFQWDVHRGDPDVVDVTPLMGRLRPGEKVACKISLYAGFTQRVHEVDLALLVRDDSLGGNAPMTAVGAISERMSAYDRSRSRFTSRGQQHTNSSITDMRKLNASRGAPTSSITDLKRGAAPKVMLARSSNSDVRKTPVVESSQNDLNVPSNKNRSPNRRLSRVEHRSPSRNASNSELRKSQQNIGRSLNKNAPLPPISSNHLEASISSSIGSTGSSWDAGSVDGSTNVRGGSSRPVVELISVMATVIAYEDLHKFGLSEDAFEMQLESMDEAPMSSVMRCTQPTENLIRATLSDMLEDVFRDPDIQNRQESPNIPFFMQFSQKPANMLVVEDVDSGLRAPSAVELAKSKDFMALIEGVIEGLVYESLNEHIKNPAVS